MSFVFGCLAVIIIIVSLVASMEHQKGNDYCIIHWLFGFCAAVLFIIFAVLGIWW